MAMRHNFEAKRKFNANRTFYNKSKVPLLNDFTIYALLTINIRDFFVLVSMLGLFTIKLYHS